MQGRGGSWAFLCSPRVYWLLILSARAYMAAWLQCTVKTPSAALGWNTSSVPAASAASSRRSQAFASEYGQSCTRSFRPSCGMVGMLQQT